MLIVVLCTYILFVVLSSTSVMDLIGGGSISLSPVLSYLIAFLIMPVMSCIFILMAHNMQKSAFPDLKDLYKKAIIFLVPAFVVIAVFGFMGSLQQAISPLGLPEISCIALVGATLPLAIQYHRIAKINYNAEESIPSFIRDITESQKTGMSPGKKHCTGYKTQGLWSILKVSSLNPKSN